ncbi:hypothetical protein CcrC1_gp257c [Caulobacter phage C1]|nr:hypothetical protein CcrC1_gp257c [Caulobacter phage C1]UTU08486.1 hypothetical protein CcrC2_gp258c [Caulobacter phage C2]UTU09001.1 hypothetical protein CcrJ4_gp252c [Caulobacter phage J4]UTU09562.1 hypothetical protein CcrBL47_gp276c [Caulobacter phage BL47]UTU10119.1 hypothetical protein CcrRB23_gp257c [Caulobacter phage RB23]WGN97154.1 hypothetical protein [Bertelyvirus sp.]
MTDLVFKPLPHIFAPILIKGGKQKKMARYAVERNGEVIGWIGQRPERQEKSIPGERIVARAWESPRWYYEAKTRPGQRFGGYITRKDAVEALQRNNRVR